MSAIKYVGRNIWKVRVRFDYLGARATRTLFITTPGRQSHISHAIHATQKRLLNDETLPSPCIESVGYEGEIDA